MNNKAQTIQLNLTNAVATITLNNPKRHNALEQDDLRAFLNALEQVAAQPGLRVLVITGAGEKTFCAGVSLQQMNSGDLNTDTFEELTNRLDAFPLPTICALNGSAYGGGAEIALACDFRIGVRGSRMFVPVARFGLCYPLSGVQRYVAKLGVGPSKRLLMANETWPAEEMYRVGFLDYLVERAELNAARDALIAKITNLAPLAVQGMKQIINQLGRGEFDEATFKTIIRQCSASRDLREGLQAQAEKRAPVFKGR